ncbi:MAG: DUF3108 domain-containing protein [Acidobacteria bacterium]|nr:DUF3108 domain-containing protein [Acidobacteriota bacterium]
MGSLFLAAFAVVLLAAQNPPPTAPRTTPEAGNQAVIGAQSQIRPAPAGYKFPDGQRLVYEVEWRLLSAGVATLHMDNSGQEQHITGNADSIGVVSLLYRVHDRFESYFDTKTFCSSLMTKHTEEGFRRLDTLIRFEYGRRKSVLQQKNLKNGQTRQAENDIPACATDIVSGIFYVGSLPLQSGVSYTFPLNDGGTTVDVQARVEAREEVKTPAGTFQALRVQPEPTSGPLKQKGRIWIWYSDDTAHTPVQMRARLSWGTLTFRLQRIERK